MNKGKFTLCLCLAFPLLLTGQNDHTVAFHSGTTPKSAFLKPSHVTPAIRDAAAFGQRSYLLLQFEDIPNVVDMQILAAMGVSLLHYMPNYAYFSSLPANLDLAALPGLRSVLLPRWRWKLSRQLIDEEYPAHALSDAGIRLEVFPYDDIPAALLAECLEAMGYVQVEVFPDRVELTLPIQQIQTLASFPAVLYVSPVEAPSFSEGHVGRSQVRSNFLSAGPQLGFDGLGVSLALGDDGLVPHQDVKGRVINHTTLDTGTHGDMTLGILSGAGNINPKGIGMATGAMVHLYYYSDYPHIVNAIENFLAHGTVITSTSYGDGCGGIYSNTARTLDMQVVLRRELLHVFSAGNNGLTGCGAYGNLGYFNGLRFGNITGGRKAAKHALLIGNTFYDDSLRINSSKGPLLDGMLKPDMVAHGQDNLSLGPNNTYLPGGGTSAAAPVVAGLSAQLYQAYRNRFNGANPTFAHIKTALLNTADDLGRPGPDYEYGWGRPHGGRALNVIQNNWFFQGTVAHQGQNTHTIPVPAGAYQLRVMVYWFDPAATLNAPKSLVNDLDMTLVTPNNTSVRPWVLSTAMHIDSITKPAYRGTDRVNPMEQITIDNPQIGNYQIQIKGHLIPQGPQDYVIAYYIEQQPLAVAYPIGSESFVPGEIEVIRWDAVGNQGQFRIEYSTDNMATWQNIATGLDGKLRHFDWTIPATVTGGAFIRVSRNGISHTSPAAFNIIGLPNFNIQNGGEYEARVSWSPVPGANRYTVYAMSERYMEPIGTTSDTTFLVPVQPFSDNWYSVAAGHSSGITGRRAYAKPYFHTPCQTGAQLTIKFDQFPGETRWEIRNNAGNILTMGGPYTGYTPHSTIVETLCLPYGCFELVVYDDYNDGLCCQNGQGFYQLRNAAGTIIASGSQFGNIDTRPFCLNAPGSPLSATAFVQQQVSCPGGTDGIARVNATQGTGAYYYNWSNGATTATVSNLGAGAYTVTVSDGTSQVVASVVITAPQPLQVNTSATSATCASQSNGALTAVAGGGTPPYAYQWSNGQTGASINGLAAGAYALTVIDQKGCTTVVTTAVQQPAAVTVTALITPAGSGNNSSIILTVNGGVAPYLFAWSNGATTQNLSGPAPGAYSVTVTDANNCSTQRSFTMPGANSTSLCAARGVNTGFEWIQSVQIGGMTNPSGNNGGYAYFNQITMAMTAGNVVAVTLQPGYAGNPYMEYWKIWIDLNRDNNFNDTDEAVFSGAGSGIIQGAFTLPAGYVPGQTLLRVAMRYGAYPAPCGNFPYGEVEDYNVTLLPATGPGYCASSGTDNIHEWIQSVQIGTLTNTSGPNGGYGNFTHLTAEAHPGSALEVSLTPGFYNNFGGERWRVWIDFNQDGDFDDPGETVLSSALSNVTLNAAINIPTNALTGATRMRISMRWNAWPGPCDQFGWGEVEDYTLNITNNFTDDGESGQLRTNAGNEPAPAQPMPDFLISEIPTVTGHGLRVFPNPAASQVAIAFHLSKEETVDIQLFDLNGKPLRRIATEAGSGENQFTMDLRGLNPGAYVVVLRAGGTILRQRLVVVAQ
jgi:hypothetical protein